jgi:urea transport system permease protein
MITRRLLEAPDGRGWIFLAILAAAAIAVPCLNILVPPDSPFHITTTTVALWGKYLCFALLALSLDLVWGYCGILSLGHGAFFALGGYAMGMYLMRQIGTRGSYAHPILPDFMMFLNWKELPWYWYGFDFFPYALLMIVLVPGALAFVFGWFAFRSRVTGVYLSIITQALTFALMLGFFRNNFGFGGNNGLTDFYDLLGFSVRAPETRAVLFSLSAVALGLGYLIAQAVVRSKAGKVLIAIRDAESRTRFLGYRVENYKTYVFTLSACMAGVAGALYVPQVGIINPSEFAPANSIEYVIWVAVGGRGTLIGAALGAIIVNYLKTIFTIGALAPYWLFVLGAIFVLVTIFLPRGVLGLLPSWRSGASADSVVPSPVAPEARAKMLGEGQGGGDARTLKAGLPPSPSPSPKGEGGPGALDGKGTVLPGRPTPQPAE